MSFDSSMSSPAGVLRANPLIGGDQQLTPNTSMDESLFLDTSSQFINDETSMLCFSGGGGRGEQNNMNNNNNNMRMGDDGQEGNFFRNMYIRLD